MPSTWSKVAFFSMIVVLITTGAAFTALSAYLLNKYDQRQEVMVTNSYDALWTFNQCGLYLCISIGSVMFLGGIIGFLGGIKRSPVILTVFFMGLLIISTLWLTAGLYFALNQDEVLEHFQTQMTHLIQNSYGADYMAQSQLWDFTQKNIKCCGAAGFEDYSSKDLSSYMVPKSCCNDSLSEEKCEGIRNILIIPGTSDEFANLHDFEFIYKEGCVESLTRWMKSMCPYFGGVILGMGSIWMLSSLSLTAYFIWTFRYRQYLVASNQIGPERIEMARYL